MANIVVLTCIDPRYTEVLANYLIHQAQVHDTYDLVVLAGSSLGVLATAGGSNPLSGTPVIWPIISTATNSLCTINWSKMFDDHVNIALALHNVTEVWVFDHLDCGAYKAFMTGLTTDTDVAPHHLNLTQFGAYVESKWPRLAYKSFMMDLPSNNFEITLFDARDGRLDASGHIGITIPDPSATGVSYWAVILAVGLAVLVFKLK